MDTRYMTVLSISRRPEVAGLILWGVAVATVPAPLAARLWLAVPFVLVPRLAPALSGIVGGTAGPAAAWPWLSVGAGSLAALALALPVPTAAGAALVIPWLLLTLGDLATSAVRVVHDRS